MASLKLAQVLYASSRDVILAAIKREGGASGAVPLFAWLLRQLSYSLTSPVVVRDKVLRIQLSMKDNISLRLPLKRKNRKSWPNQKSQLKRPRAMLQRL
jgi:hypothetical protein